MNDEADYVFAGDESVPINEDSNQMTDFTESRRTSPRWTVMPSVGTYRILVQMNIIGPRMDNRVG